jgi:hypothetical protein
MAHIDAFIAAYNIDAKPFVWTKSEVHQKRLNVWSGRVSQGVSTLWTVVLHQCIRPLLGAIAPGHHGYQRTLDLFSGQTSLGHLRRQYSIVPGRPVSIVSLPLADLGG